MMQDKSYTPFDVILPWPDKALSSNARVHWTKRHKANKAQRALAWGFTINALKGAALAPPIDMEVTFMPPDKRKRDRHNLPMLVKGAIDGVADALGIDDYFFNVTFSHAEPIKGGMVLIQIQSRKTLPDH